MKSYAYQHTQPNTLHSAGLHNQDPPSEGDGAGMAGTTRQHFQKEEPDSTHHHPDTSLQDINDAFVKAPEAQVRTACPGPQPQASSLNIYRSPPTDTRL